MGFCFLKGVHQVYIGRFSLVAVFCAGAALAQSGSSASAALAPRTTLPVAFTKTIDANHATAGDPVTARTIQTIRLADGREVRSGAQVLGHVVSVQPFVVDKTPYAKEKEGLLAIQFDSLATPSGEKIPLQVYLRAMADTFASTAALEPPPSDLDPLHSTTQVGGDILTPSQAEIVNQQGDIVGYNKRGGAYAHLIANSGRGAARCDASDTEQAMALFSASACGLYGFADLNLTSTGFESDSSTFTLTSRRRSPEIFRHSTALLEVVSGTSIASVTR